MSEQGILISEYGGWTAQSIDPGNYLQFTTFERVTQEFQVHVYPNNDLVTHELTMDCACGPELSDIAGVISHRSWDQREIYEENYPC